RAAGYLVRPGRRPGAGGLVVPAALVVDPGPDAARPGVPGRPPGVGRVRLVGAICVVPGRPGEAPRGGRRRVAGGPGRPVGPGPGSGPGTFSLARLVIDDPPVGSDGRSRPYPVLFRLPAGFDLSLELWAEAAAPLADVRVVGRRLVPASVPPGTPPEADGFH